MSEPVPYNPLDKANLGKSVADALLQQPKAPLRELKSFDGVGIYAIYYIGTFEAYRLLTDITTASEVDIPIYVGKADREGKRKGMVQSNAKSSKKLWKRLNEHAESINASVNLNLEDFWCRYLVVDDIWVSLGESLLIARFAPLWNQLVEGFGNHDPGSGRHEGARSRWDVLHPGRKWAEKLKPRPESPEQIINDINIHLRSSAVIQKLAAGRFPFNPGDISIEQL